MSFKVGDVVRCSLDDNTGEWTIIEVGPGGYYTVQISKVVVSHVPDKYLTTNTLKSCVCDMAFWQPCTCGQLAREQAAEAAKPTPPPEPNLPADECACILTFKCDKHYSESSVNKKIDKCPHSCYSAVLHGTCEHVD